MRIEFVASDRTTAPKGGAVAVMAFEGGQLSGAAGDLDQATGGAVTRAIAASSRFAAKPGQTVELIAPAGVDVQRLIIVGAEWRGRRDLRRPGLRRRKDVGG
jgi:leucyl aminopeptidase